MMVTHHEGGRSRQREGNMEKENMVFHDGEGNPYVLVTEEDGTEQVEFLDVENLPLLERLEALPSYETRLVTAEVQGFTFQHRWMARDIPGKGRRFTDLDSGTEIFPRPREGFHPINIVRIEEVPAS